MKRRTDPSRLDRHLVPQWLLDLINLVTVFLVIITLALMVIFILNTRKAQICGQHDTAVAIRQIGRELGLPAHIHVPDIAGVGCE